MSLIKKIKNRKSKIGVIGLGYVGLPLAIEFTNAGFEVVGIDLDKKKVNQINNGFNYINDVDSNILKNAVENNILSASSDFSIVDNLDAISICVPTPLNKQKNPDISYIVSVMDNIKHRVHKNMLIILEIFLTLITGTVSAEPAATFLTVSLIFTES